MNVSLRLAFVLMLGLHAAAPATAFVTRPGPEQELIAPQRPVSPSTWRSMRTLWTFRPHDKRWSGRIDQLTCDGDRIFYVCDCEAGTIDAITGRQLWRYRFGEVTRGAGPYNFFNRNIVVSKRSLIVVTGPNGVDPMRGPFQALALSIASGKPIWSRSLTGSPLDAPCLSGGLLLVPMSDASLLALQSTTGETAWHKRILPTNPDKQGSYPRFALRANAQTAIVQLGSGHIIALRVRDGTRMWSTPINQNGEYGGAHGAVFYNRCVFAVCVSDGLIAIDESTGRRLWKQPGAALSSEGPPVVSIGDVIVTVAGETEVAVNPTNGKTRWYVQPDAGESTGSGPSLFPWPGRPGPAGRMDTDLAEIRSALPRVNGVQRPLRTVPTVQTLVMRNPVTGRERWRWQPEDATPLDKIVSDGNRIYVAGWDGIRAFDAGKAPFVPETPSEQLKRAKRAIFALFEWKDDQQSSNEPISSAPTDRSGADGAAAVMERAQAALSSRNSNLSTFISKDEACLTLLRLGSEGTTAVLHFVRHDTALKAPDTLKLREALDLLYDTGRSDFYPELADTLDRCIDTDSRTSLTETMIRSGDSRVLPALFRYAQSPSDNADTRLDALYCICQGTGASLARLVTEYLMSVLRDQSTPNWLRLFARFELLNGRGSEARNAALATFERSERSSLSLDRRVFTDDYVRRIPPPPPGSPIGVKIDSKTRDGSGHWWAAFNWDFLGSNSDLWIAQSEDGKSWSHVLYCLNQSKHCDRNYWPGPATIRFRDKGFDLEWPEYRQTGEKTFEKKPHRERLTIAELTRDTDGDGLSDLLERAIGTDPTRSDTNGNGIPDSLDKNPTYRPHAHSDEEAIFQTVLEALLYTHAGSYPRGSSVRPRSDPQLQFGAPDKPLVLSLPAGSSGIRVQAPSGPVIYRPLAASEDRFAMFLNGGSMFTPPTIGLNGLASDTDSRRIATETWNGDPFADQKAITRSFGPPRPWTFHNYFPVDRSADGNRARVGFTESDGDQGSSASYDVEVRKIDGVWYAVECRLMQTSWHLSSSTAVFPEHKTHDER